ncbi:PqqD family protein [Fodinicurvata sediminis]|uniref:PqqD family protein n=1 Tax=Fodinicurvata sediminis TaxID=1121832 RepID=UPI0003B7423A|nr:PqqD family protein [Fodinicurvata sediminis]
MPRQTVLFHGMQRPVVFVDCPEIPLALREIAPSWQFREQPETDHEPAVVIHKLDDAYGIGVSWRATPWFSDTLVGAVCSLAVDLIESHLVDNAGLLGLHGASACFGQGLVLFPAEQRAGKSTLSAQLLLDGVRVYGDDLIALDAQDQGMAYGFAPRLRLPLPEGISGEMKSFIMRNGGARDDDYIYLSPELSNLARYGEQAPLAAIVLLDRRDEGGCHLERLPESEGLHHLAAQYLAREASTDEVLERCRKLAESLPTYNLRYANLEAASACLQAHFSQDQALAASGQIARGAPASWPSTGNIGASGFTDGRVERKDDPDGHLPDIPRGHPHVQAAGVKAQRLDGDLFLSHSATGTIHRLNPIGASLWGLLAVPTSLDEAQETFRTAFPDVEPSRLENDLQRIFQELLAETLIQPV